jgi:hypothetical protein
MLFLLIAILTFAAWGLSIAAIVWGIRRYRKSNPKNDKYWIGVPIGCGCLPFIFILVMFGFSWGVETFQSPASSYERVFKVHPDKAIRNLQADVESSFDSYYIYLAFGRSDVAWANVVELAGGGPSGPETAALDSIVSQGVPAWFNAGSPWLKRNTCKDAKRYFVNNYKGWDDIVLVNCRSDGRIYVMAGSID